MKGGTLVDDDSESIQIDFPDGLGTVELSALRAESLNDARWLQLTGRGYQTEEGARQVGESARELINFLQVERRVDIDLGDNQERGRVGDVLKERIKSSSEKNIEIYDSVHGLAIYPEDPTPIISTSRAEFTVERHWERDLQELLPDLYESDLSLDKRTSLSCSLYGTAQSANSPRAAFLFLVTAIESLLEPSDRSEQAVSLVDRFIEEVEEAGLDDAERNSLLGSLGQLKTDSITRTGEQLVERHLGETEYNETKAPDFFGECYNIRSELLHRGEPKDESLNVSQLANNLDELVSDLLASVCGRE